MAKKVINRVYPNAEEKLVKNTIVYVNENNLYYDQDFEHCVFGKDIENLFLKGLIVCVNVDGMDTRYYNPISIQVVKNTFAALTINKDGEQVTYTASSWDAE